MNQRAIVPSSLAILLALFLNVAIVAAAADEPVDDQQADAAPIPNLTEWPINFSGNALDPDGKPVGGATIFIVATNGGPDKTLGQTVTDDGGHYTFRDVKVPIRVLKNPKDGYQEGTFQIFGKAPGYGFAWLGMKTMFVDPRFIGPDGKKTVMQPHLGYFPGEKIEIDLVFSPAKTISGRFVDDHGQPIAGLKLYIGVCDYARLAGKEPDRQFRHLNAIRQACALMPDQLKATTDADGNFSFNAVPPDVICSINAEHPDYGKLSFNTSTTIPPLKQDKDQQLLAPPILMTLPKCKTISATVTFADTKRPAHNALLRAYVKLGEGTDSWGYADKNGKVTLKLPPGEYKLASVPPTGTDYLKEKSTLVVAQQEAKQLLDVELKPGGILILKAVDFVTGKGIEDVTFWYQDDNYPWDDPGKREPGKRWFVQSNTTTNDFPKTDETGTVRAVVYPGSRVYGVGLNPLPDGYSPLDGDTTKGLLINVPAGETVTTVHFLKKK